MSIRFHTSLIVAAVVGGAVTLPSGAPKASTSSSGATRWVARYNGPGNGVDYGDAIAASPDGTRVFITGRTFEASFGDYVTVAYAAATGTELWSTRYDGPGAGDDEARSIAVSPDGSKVFVSGSSYGGPATGFDYATVAYDAPTGAQLWVARYDGPEHQDDDAFAIAVGSDGRKVFVTGGSGGAHYATVAYSASTGGRLWTSRYAGIVPGSLNSARALAVSPDATRVFVTGWSYGDSAAAMDYSTVAYRASSGGKLWIRRYNGPGGGDDDPHSIAVGGDGKTVFVTGFSPGTTGLDFATIAYYASTGATRWLTRYHGAAFVLHAAPSIAATKDGTKVFVTGSRAGTTTGADYATIAYRGSTGARLWERRYAGSGADWVHSVAVNGDGTKVFVTGESYGGTTTDYNGLTFAYAAANGGQLWWRRYDGLGHGYDAFLAIATGGTKVFVTGETYTGATAGFDAVTVAYQY
jgi:hypothetical protein